MRSPGPLTQWDGTLDDVVEGYVDDGVIVRCHKCLMVFGASSPSNVYVRAPNSYDIAYDGCADCQKSTDGHVVGPAWVRVFLRDQFDAGRNQPDSLFCCDICNRIMVQEYVANYGDTLQTTCLACEEKQ